ncbi:MAG: L,D-transpeptidase family protein, partial [Actinobacteria bacterium]|nr:L,D-transpeptidase family protein [Actinomycetota bacterium]
FAASAALVVLLAPTAARGEEPPPDFQPPETSITAGPDRVAVSRLARFELVATEPATFECSLDGAPYAACPARIAYSGLAVGRHALEARATDAAGNVDATPARYAWEIVRPEPPAPFRLSGDTVSRWAPVLKRAIVRAKPSLGSRRISRLALRTPERTQNLVLVLERLEDARGRLWIRVRIPVLPNNRTGWVLRGAIGGYTAVPTRLIVERKRFTITLFKYGKAVFRSRIGVGKPSWPTPRGEFYIRVKLASFDDPFYGPIAFGTSAKSSVLTDWPAGGHIGIHGTNLPELLPGRVSHGCIRMRNEDILRLARMLPIGTPLTIR